MEKELEVKVLNVDFAELESLLTKLGASLVSEEDQMNIIINSLDNPIEDRLNGYLRIRISKNLQNGQITNTLTFKENISRDGSRENIEYNVNIDSVDNTLRLLNKLGFDQTQIGYKHRKSYIYKTARVDFDIWDKDTYPYPYVEIEAKSNEELREIVEDLGISPKNISFKSIKELKEDLLDIKK